MAFHVFGSILSFAIFGLVQVLHDLGACRLRSFEVRINIVDEDCEALSMVARLCRTHTSGSRAIEHNPGSAQIYLRAFYPPTWFSIPVMLGEAECLR
jgi:hypothetical protein